MSESGLQEAREPWYRVVLAWLGRLVMAYLIVGGIFTVLILLGIVPSSPLWALAVIFWPVLLAYWLRSGG